MFNGRIITLEEKTSARSMLESRKYRLTLICILALIAGLLLGLINPIFVQTYSVYVGGIVSVLALYCGFNVSQKWVQNKISQPIEDTNDVYGE